MQYVTCLTPFQVSAEKIVDELREKHGVLEKQIAVVFADNRSPFRLGFRPRTLETGEQIVEVVRFKTRSRYNGIVISVQVKDLEETLMVESVLDKVGVLWKGRSEDVEIFEPEFSSPEWMSKELGGMLRNDYRI